LRPPIRGGFCCFGSKQQGTTSLDVIEKEVKMKTSLIRINENEEERK